ncbi:MAG: tRNA pseudouridine(55) synthase TruB [Thiotrichales bacterium]|nr:tRNA pseudouridine(55) synthase TruB [Thiotrichales bacterium]
MSQFRRAPRQKIDGIVLLNKPVGVSSNGILQKVRGIFNAEKAGHTGALDPFASGLLPICLGEATKVSGLLLDAEKRYTATLKLGVQTDSGDVDGQVLAQAPIPTLSVAQIEQVFAQFCGPILQVPPMYSALKHQGKPLYAYARQGIEIERPARPVTIFSLQLISWQADVIVFDVLCSKGTYVRTLGEDIAHALGTLGHLIALHRTQTGSIRGEQMLTLEQIEIQKTACLQPLDLALQHLPRLDLDLKQTRLLQQGGMLALPKLPHDWVRFYDANGRFFGIGEWHAVSERIKPKRLFNFVDTFAQEAGESV